MEMQYDVIVVGAGHAGCEAATASARLGAETLLVTMDMNKIAQMSCNPAVGGIAKGQIVREIDALGGWMGIVTDDCAIQFRMLNRSKGPAMWSPRAQCDRGKFIWRWREILENQPHLHIWQDQAMELIVEDGRACGVRTLFGCEIRAKAVVVCAGTFLNGLMHVGPVKIPGGRVAEPASTGFGQSIARHGVRIGRMKTGTPVRIDGRTVHFDELARQDGDDVITSPHTAANSSQGCDNVMTSPHTAANTSHDCDNVMTSPHTAANTSHDCDNVMTSPHTAANSSHDCDNVMTSPHTAANSSQACDVADESAVSHSDNPGGNPVSHSDNPGGDPISHSDNPGGDPISHSDKSDESGSSQGLGRFSFMNSGKGRRLPQLPCWTLYSTPECHAVLRAGLPESPLYNGQIQSIGPRYCPSIETKLVTFPEREQHQLFLEPEGTDTQEYYLNGFSSSLPLAVQFEALRKIPAFRDIEIYRPGYAIEYDYFDPTQLRHTLESKIIEGLYLAGQVNGTTGYEEAAGQGLVAGANAALKIGENTEFVMRRDESYIGVLIDDLVTKGVDEPYRMFTSRAEYRILLRQDNADERLTERAYKIGLATQERYDAWIRKKQSIERLLRFVSDFSVKADRINHALIALGTAPLERGCKVLDLIGRPELNFSNLRAHIPALAKLLDGMRPEAVEAAEIKIKYSGYIRREREYADKMVRLENIRIKDKFDYNSLESLSTEARQKLTRINPETLAQASRIPGVSPSDVNVLLVLMRG